MIKNKQNFSKRLGLYSMLTIGVLFLSGCMRLDEAGAPKGFTSELIYNYLVMPLYSVLHYLASHFGGYGVALVLLTLLVRVLLVPTSLKQQRTLLESQAKMKMIQPITDQIQAQIKQTSDPHRQQELQMELAKVYQQNGIGLGSQLSSCLPLFIQMPIFVAIFHIINHSPDIAAANFLGLKLGERSLVLAVLVAAIYYLRSKLMAVEVDDQEDSQAQQMNASMNMSMPIMFFLFSISGPAGVAIYWLIGGIVELVQQLFVNKYYRPKIKKELDEQLQDTPTYELPEELIVTPTATDEEVDATTQKPVSTTDTVKEKNRQRNLQAKKRQRQRRKSK